MSHRASSHRFIVMESYVHMLGGKVKNIEDTIKKLVEVLTSVIIDLLRDLNILQLCLLFLLPNFWQEKMLRVLISLNYVLNSIISLNMDSNLKKLGFYMLNHTLRFKNLIMLKKFWECYWEKTDLVVKLKNWWDWSDRKSRLMLMLLIFTRRLLIWQVVNQLVLVSV